LVGLAVVRSEEKKSLGSKHGKTPEGFFLFRLFRDPATALMANG
jgi:hypothetical protein